MVTQEERDVLHHVAVRTHDQPTWHLYGQYCELRGKGLRKAALHELDAFVCGAHEWTFDARCAFVEWRCQTIYEVDWIAYHPLGTRLLTTPLFVGLVQPTLRTWIERDPTNIVAHRWAGLFLDERDHLRRAVALDATEQIARVGLVGGMAHDISVDQHHLPEYYIGDPAQDVQIAQEAEQYIAGITDSAVHTRLTNRVVQLRHVAQDWIAVLAAGESDYAQWCAQKGHPYGTDGATFYYAKRK